MMPLVHDFEGERVLVFGAGQVGARKARHFASEASVFVVSPQFEDESYGGAELLRTAPAPDDVPGWLSRIDPALVVAATDDAELNERIEAEASERGILCNRADVAGPRGASSVVVPATVRDDPVVVSVSTGATSPVVSRHLRQELETAIDGAGEMAELTGSLREELAGPDRRAALRAVVSSGEVWKALDTEGTNPRKVATDVIAEATGESV
ncbi:MAG: precorrin-2 dehydrogenase/sirohydrochlorin ferrochelatase family protein [Halovenus sp.]